MPESVSGTVTLMTFKTTYRSNNVSNVRDRRSGSSTEVQDFFARGNVDVIQTAKDTGSKLGSERIPHSVLGLCAISVVNRDSLFSIDGFARDKVLGNQHILFSTGNEHTGMSMRFDNDLGSTSRTESFFECKMIRSER